ncbi:hypothetical protein [Nocardia sp. alder85J]|uniref:hypothetical protein n=1 Tax=Nocardia sp. alder85J TaxID=2862949 RepID=UPI001CD1960D|nr:hypothetical protein [Nocardia sp. alder85J]MCX4092169.1 hypothetical protein [Nocardia sp. alder85J]
MIKRLVLFALMPAWIWVGIGVIGALGGIFVALAVITGSIVSSGSADFHYQCDSAVGPDPSDTETATTAAAPTTGAESLEGTEIPTTNPYASLTFDAGETDVSDWQRACVSAMKSAPYQLPALFSANAGSSAQCAQQLALALLNPPSGTSGSGSGSTVSDPALAAVGVVYGASSVSSTGRCIPTSVSTTGSSTGMSDNTYGSVPGTACPATDPSAPIALPNTIAAQSLCGQRVDSSAVSAGDLVYWGYQNYTPTKVGIAVSRGQVVAFDSSSGRLTEQSMPSGKDVRVKRVLGGS